MASVTTILRSWIFWTCISISDCVAFSLVTTTFAAAITILSVSCADFNFSSKVTILAFKISFFTVSTFDFSSFVTLVSDIFVPTFDATADATLSLVFSKIGLLYTFGTSKLPWVTSIVFNALFNDISPACATDPAPKKILAPITTDAAPILNFLIEYVSTLVPFLTSYK